MNKKAKIIITVLAILCIWFWMSAKFSDALYRNAKGGSYTYEDMKEDIQKGWL